MFKFIFLTFFVAQSYAATMNFEGVFWIKENCREVGTKCVPKVISEKKKYSMIQPQKNSARKLKVEGEYFDARLIWIQRNEKLNYYSFQIEIVDKLGKTIALCSRYEGIKSFEKVPVGACAGNIPDSDEMIGFSIMLPSDKESN